ncbi:tyrosine-type recombinase/integrase [Bifidobacterium apri]|uniref:tyrosine-type recombinase/integrase n=1 Tax=Bifidobacterium apri TaxID=1769423 RepID=UPI003992C491
MALLYATGIRVSELCRLHCGDIHRIDRYIYSRSKNRSDRRAVWSDHASELLRAYMYFDRDYQTATTDFCVLSS